MRPQLSVLDQLHIEYNNTEWLNEHEAGLRKALTQALRNDDTVDLAIDSLLMMMPYILFGPDLRPWSKLLNNAQRIGLQHMGVTEQEGSREQVGEVYVLPNEHRAPEVRTTATKRRRRPRMHPTKMFEIYLRLWLAWHRRTSTAPTAQRIEAATDFARTVNDQYMYHKLYQTIAFAYYYSGDYTRALDMAHFSYNHFRNTGAEIEVAQTAYVLGISYSRTQQYEEAMRWLDIASDTFVRLEYPRQHGLVALETGCLHLYQHEYEAAVQWMEQGLREFLALDAPYYVATAYHYLGMAQAYYEDYVAARDNVNQAYQMFDKQKDTRNMAHTLHTLGYIEARLGEKDEALSTLEDSLRLWIRIPDSAFKAFTIEKINRLIKAVERDEDLSELDAAN